MSSCTPLQQAIISACANNPEVKNTEVAENIGCSPTYVGRVRNENENKIEEKEYPTDVSVHASFGSPYSIFLSKEARNILDVTTDDVVELSFLVDKNNRTYYTSVKDIDSIDIEEEIRHLLYSVYNLDEEYYGQLPKELSELFKEDEDSSPRIYTKKGLERALKKLERKVEIDIAKSDCFIGAGIYEQISEDSGRKIIQTPSFNMTSQNFIECFNASGIPLFDISKYKGEVDQPETVYFMSNGGSLNDDKKDKITEDILDVKYFNKISYIISKSDAVRGPAPVETESSVFEVTEDSIEVITESAKVISTYEEEDHFEYSTIEGLIDNVSLKGEGENYVSLQKEKYPDYNIIILKISTLRVPIFINDDEISVMYFSEVDQLDEFVSDLIEYISSNIAHPHEVFGPRNVERESKLDPNTWVLDTNSIYHQVPPDEASSILYTILPNMDLYGSEFILPWSLIYEINKHKNTDDAGPSVRNQGVENINILNILSEYDFIDLSYEDVPDESISEIETSALADMYVLSTAQKNDAAMFTSDKELSRLCKASGIHTVNILEHAFIEPEKEPDQSLWEEIKQEFNHGPISREDLLDLVVSQSKEKAAKENTALSLSTETDLQDQADDYIHEWLKKELIMPFKQNSELKYAVTHEFAVVPTYDLISHISDHVTSDNYLDETFLDKLRKKYGLKSYERPMLNLYIPESYVLQAQSECSTAKIEGTLKSLLSLNCIKNAKYTPISVANNNDSLVKDALEISKQKDCLLLCRDGDNNLDKLSGLLGVKVKKLVSK
jgi:hypothetical protein